ncbi:LptA/OstA family protein [Curvivirga sp.]|uniref:LptA/OstA family protein n=1 Tax=Curvivirga sp. TaxID=2856848 RepID=UPI003B5B8D5D
MLNIVKRNIWSSFVLALSISFASIHTSASAQTATVQQDQSNKPVEIEADNGIEWIQEPGKQEGYYKAIGNAIAKQGDLNITSDELIAHYRTNANDKQDVHRIDAEGSVVVNQQETNAYGDRGAFHMQQQVAVLVGQNLRLIDPRATITARDALEFWSEKNIAVARGDALLITEDKRMQAGVMTAFIGENITTGKNEVTRIDATSGVHISTPTEIVTGQEGVYDLQKEIATLCGNVKISRGENQLNGECAEVNMKTGRSKLLGGDSRVKGLILNNN